MKYRRNRESGFALLFIYAMAATVAIMLLMALPRVAFEAQRDKEQLLIYRGEQYSRAINLYVRKFNKFPADFDALKSTQNLRFLRHKYTDPMTGKDDWRLIHVGPGGVFTDSLVYGKKKDDKQQAEQQTFITEMQQTGGTQVDPNQNINVGTRQRVSDQAGAPGDPNNPAQPPQFDVNGQPVQNTAAPVQVLPNGQIVPVQQPVQQPGNQQGNQFGNQPGFPGQFQPGMNGPVPGQPFPNLSGQQQFNQPPNGPNTAAGNLINQLLTTPRPGGLNGGGGFTANAGTATTGTTIGTPITSTAAPMGQTIGGGIAGVASKLEEDGIKVYKDQTSYHKWEFVYDITKDPARAGGAVPTAAPPPGTPIGGAPPGAPGTPTATPATTTTTPTTPAPVTSP